MHPSLRASRSLWTHLTALGFVAGAMAHAIGFVLFLFGIRWYGPHYPWWRHVVMVAADVIVVWVALYRTSWLIPVLLAFAAEQFAINGVHATGVAVLIAAILVAVRPLSNREFGSV